MQFSQTKMFRFSPQKVTFFATLRNGSFTKKMVQYCSDLKTLQDLYTFFELLQNLLGFLNLLVQIFDGDFLESEISNLNRYIAATIHIFLLKGTSEEANALEAPRRVKV